MSEPPKIIDLQKVLEPHLDGGQLISYTSRYLTKPGENYGSLMLAINANVRRQDGGIDVLPLVAKLPPVTNEFYWKVFQPERTAISENTVYKYLGPALRQLQLEAGVAEEALFDSLPRYYGSRISLDAAATVVDRDAVLLQENLQLAGYKAGNRHQMYDYAHTKLLLQVIAQYHALPIALRLKKPAEFDAHVRPYFRRFNMNSTMGPEVAEQLNEETLKEIRYATNNNDRAVERVRELLQAYDEYLSSPDASDTLFTTLVHCDMWINNLMLKYDENGAPAKVKIVDFQTAQYESLAHDVLFLLFSSVATDVLEKHMNDFLRIYYDAFVQCLQEAGVTTAEYTFELFLAEIKRVAPLELPHALFMTKVILADNSTMPDDFADMDISIINKNSGVPEISKKTADIVKLAEKFKYFY